MGTTIVPTRLAAQGLPVRNDVSHNTDIAAARSEREREGVASRQLRSLMPQLQPANRPSPAQKAAARAAQIERWEKLRAMGRTDFILRRGVVGWGIPAAVFTVLYKVIQEQGFVLSPHLTDSLRTAIVVALLLFPAGGGLLGRWLWSTGEARYQAMIRERDRSRS